MRDLRDELVKGVFDNVRNYVLASVVISTGVVTARSGFAETIDWYLAVIGIYIVLIGFSLFSLNVVHAWKKFQELNLSKWIFIATSTTYTLITIEFVRTLWVSKAAVGL